MYSFTYFEQEKEIVDTFHSFEKIMVEGEVVAGISVAHLWEGGRVGVCGECNGWKVAEDRERRRV